MSVDKTRKKERKKGTLVQIKIMFQFVFIYSILINFFVLFYWIVPWNIAEARILLVSVQGPDNCRGLWQGGHPIIFQIKTKQIYKSILDEQWPSPAQLTYKMPVGCCCCEMEKRDVQRLAEREERVKSLGLRIKTAANEFVMSMTGKASGLVDAGGETARQFRSKAPDDLSSCGLWGAFIWQWN